jgi:hypothetical protein
MSRFSLRGWSDQGQISLTWADLMEGQASSDPLVAPLIETWAALARRHRGDSRASGVASFEEGLALHRLIDGLRLQGSAA